MIEFPLWVLHPLFSTDRHAACNPRGFRYAFSSVQQAADFLLTLNARHISIRLVLRADVADVARELHAAGVRGICLNPKANGDGWTFSVEDLAQEVQPGVLTAPG